MFNHKASHAMCSLSASRYLRHGSYSFAADDFDDEELVCVESHKAGNSEEIIRWTSIRTLDNRR